MLEKPWILVPKSSIVHSFIPMTEFSFLMVMSRETIKALVLSGFGAVGSLDGPMDLEHYYMTKLKFTFLVALSGSFCLVMILTIGLIAH